MAPILANSVLPARRSGVSFEASDGVRLRGELAVPDWCDPVATLVCIHPLTTEGGSMESHLIRKISWRLPALTGVAVLRYNMRGAGVGGDRSGGVFEAATGEGLDLGAALSFVRSQGLPDPYLVGWSFGTDVILKFGARRPVAGCVLLSPPHRYADQDDHARWHEYARPMTALIPEFDDYLPMGQARETFGDMDNLSLIEVKGAGHLWVGERYVQRVLNEITRVIVPAAHPLPTEWDGPMERWSDL